MKSRFRNIQRFQRQARVAVATHPFVFPLPQFMRFVKRPWLGLFFGGIIFTAAVLYIVSVNGMLLSGEAIRKGGDTLKQLEREYALLEGSAIQHESPAWLEGESRKSGMVDVGVLRYVSPAESVALSR